MVGMLLDGRFRIRASVGQGMYGDVWLCEDSRCECGSQRSLVAIKEVELQRAKRALAISRHLDNPFDERRIACYITERDGHDNVLRFQHEFLERGSWFMVTEYCNGGDLLSRLQASPEKHMSEEAVVYYIRQIARGIAFLHASGIAHRDLSLENVLLHNDVCKICDFGLATEASRTCQGRVGKAYYMAPEVVAEVPYDPRQADMWSLGIMLFILLTGSPLIPTASRSERAFLALEAFGIEKILDVWKVNLTSGIIDLLAGLLEIEPHKRFCIRDVLNHQVLLEP